ncbi:MAG: hypothetical protein H7246_06385 [Phycisphaerae bacterium]|nr:hypothetical protein [Saprospiraceae bacterium]
MKANKMIENFIFETDLLAGDLDGTKWVFREFYQFYEGSFLVQVSPIKKCRQVYLLAGGTAGWLALGWKTTKGSEAHIKHSSKSFIYLKDPSWNRNAFAADFGLGGNIPLGVNSKIKVEARYQHSLSNLSNYENVDASISSLLFNVGYLHRL